MPRNTSRASRPPGSRKSDLLALERFFIRALLMQQAYDDAGAEVARAAMQRRSKEELLPLLLRRDSYFHLWVGSVNIVVEGWRDRLRCSDAAIDELLDSELSHLLADFRNSVFHYDPDYKNAALNYTGIEGFEWLEGLMIELSTYFRRELAGESLIRHITGSIT